MSEKSISPISKIEKKASAKRSAKHDAPQSKGKPIPPAKDFKEINLPSEGNKTSSFGKELGAQSQGKSSKKEAMKAKADSALKNRMQEAQRSEENGAFLASENLSTTIKENHNMGKAQSEVRDHSLSRENDGAQTDASVKKHATDSKKSKVVESHFKSSKTKAKPDEDTVLQHEIATKDTKAEDLEEIKENKFEVENSPLYRLDNDGRKPPKIEPKKTEKGKSEAETSLERTHAEEKSIGVAKSTKRSKQSRSQLKNGVKRGKDFNDGKSLDGKSGLKKLRKQ